MSTGLKDDSSRIDGEEPRLELDLRFTGAVHARHPSVLAFEPRNRAQVLSAADYLIHGRIDGRSSEHQRRLSADHHPVRSRADVDAVVADEGADIDQRQEREVESGADVEGAAGRGLPDRRTQ
jgi:hypothetical protein